MDRINTQERSIKVEGCTLSSEYRIHLARCFGDCLIRFLVYVTYFSAEIVDNRQKPLLQNVLTLWVRI